MPAPLRTLSTRLYAALLRCLMPRGFTRDHGVEAVHLFGELYEDAYRSRGAVGIARVWWASLRGLLSSAAGEWRSGVMPGRATAGGSAIARVAGGRMSGPDTCRRAMDWRERMGRFATDLRLALRGMWKNPGFTVTVVLLLGLGVGATTTIFSVVDAVLLKRLPYPAAERLVFVERGSFSGPDFRVWQERARSFDAFAAAWTMPLNLTGSGRPERVKATRVTSRFFGVLGGRPLLGRLFVPDDSVGESVAVLSYGMWQRRWGGNPDILGRRILLDGKPVVVVGVLSPEFVAPEVATETRVDVWLSLDMTQKAMNDRHYHILSVIGRLRPGVAFETARAEMDGLAEQVATAFPDTNRRDDGTAREFPIVPLLDATVGTIGGTLLLLLGAVGLLLLIACANVAHLMLARGAERAREIAVRGALGAGRASIGALLLTESMVISLAGGALGVGLAAAGVRVFRALQPGGIPRAESVSLDPRVLLFALAVSIATGLLFGLVPVLQAVRLDPNAVLKENATNVTLSGRRRRVQGALVIAEVALSLVLLTGAGLLFHSLLKLKAVDPGFAPESLIAVQLQLGAMSGGPPEGAAADAMLAQVRQIVERTAALPGASSAVAAVTAPFDYVGGSSCCWRTEVRRSAAESMDDAEETPVDPVGAGYFRTLSVAMVAGRDFEAADGRTDPVPVVINEELARRLYGEEPAVGRTLLLGDDPAIVVGVVGAVHHFGSDRPVEAQAYVPYERYGGMFPFMTLIVRAAVPPASLAPAIRDAIWDIAPDVPIENVTPIAAKIHDSMSQPRFYSTLLAVFAVAALLLAAGGIYGTLLYGVRARQRELGIRLALGARAGNLMRMVVGRGLALTLAGIALGLAGSLAVSRLLTGLLFGVSTTDIATLAAVSLILAAVALVACWLPALRASRTDPMRTLRAE